MTSRLAYVCVALVSLVACSGGAGSGSLGAGGAAGDAVGGSSGAGGAAGDAVGGSSGAGGVGNPITGAAGSCDAFRNEGGHFACPAGSSAIACGFSGLVHPSLEQSNGNVYLVVDQYRQRVFKVTADGLVPAVEIDYALTAAVDEPYVYYISWLPGSGPTQLMRRRLDGSDSPTVVWACLGSYDQEYAARIAVDAEAVYVRTASGTFRLKKSLAPDGATLLSVPNETPLRSRALVLDDTQVDITTADGVVASSKTTDCSCVCTPSASSDFGTIQCGTTGASEGLLRFDGSGGSGGSSLAGAGGGGRGGGGGFVSGSGGSSGSGGGGSGGSGEPTTGVPATDYRCASPAPSRVLAANGVGQFAVDGSGVYFVADGSLYRAARDGSGTQTLLGTALNPSTHVDAFALNDTHLYAYTCTSDSTACQLVRMRKGSSEVSVLTSDVSLPRAARAMIATGDVVYYALWEQDPNGVCGQKVSLYRYLESTVNDAGVDGS